MSLLNKNIWSVYILVSCIIKNIIMVESLFSLEKGVRR